ncbi:hypothetical protein [Actinoplanes sp. NPDC026619]|uniref:hypothetical protein n=1 Tax=Actinoplanes sp. NPDC026619 TaxID=3155798 RepID=UPI0033E6D763
MNSLDRRLLLKDREVEVGPGSPTPGIFHIACNIPVVFRAPWEKIQFKRYDTVRRGRSVTTVAEEFDFARQKDFTVTHTWGADEATVRVTGVEYDGVPARLLADGFTPWALLTQGCLSLHAAAVLVGDHLIILSGYHDAGKSTAAQSLADRHGGTLISDDSLIVQFENDGVFACAAFWEEGCPQAPVRTPRVTFALIDDGSGEFQRFGPTMASAQFVGGLYCAEECFDVGTALISELISRAGYLLLPPRPSAQVLDRILS